jgi:hypothetical protein
MTEEILRILLADLTTVRIKCAQCGVVTEMSVECLAKRSPLPARCHYCSQEFSHQLRDAFKGIAECIVELSRPDSVRQATIEFVSKSAK